VAAVWYEMLNAAARREADEADVKYKNAKNSR
jgi:hypothetical protein